MEQATIRKTKEYEDGTVFEFRYEGIPFEIFDEEKVEELIEKFLNKKVLHRDMLKNVAYIRTILNSSKEKLLVVHYKDRDNEETVKYDNGVLFLYDGKKYDDESLNYMEVKFQPNDELKVSFSDFEDKHIIEYPNIRDIKNKFDEIVEHINSLKNVKPVYLNNDTKAIIEAYKLFYGENPDFSKEDINIKIQTMLSILAQFDISFGEYSFCINERMPESLTLLQMTNRLFPLGEVTIIEDPVELKATAKETIRIVGETIRETIGNNQDMNEALITISKTIYAGRYNLVYIYDDIERLVEYPNINLTYSEANSSTQLVKRIKKKLDDNKIN